MRHERKFISPEEKFVQDRLHSKFLENTLSRKEIVELCKKVNY